MSYWESRQAREMYEAMESAEETAKEIADIYAKASRELNYQISKVYERYRDKFNLSDKEAMELLNTLRDPGDITELKRKLEGLKGTAANEIIKELESPAYRARIERLENLQSEIDRLMKDVYQQEKKVSTNHYVDQLNDSYYREIYDLKKRTGFDFSFSNVNEKEMDRILRTNWSGENYSARIWGNTQGLARDLKEQMVLAYLTGKNESDIAAEIANKFATGASNARRLVRTESAYVSGQAQAAADEEAGLDHYRILATLDLRTSEICQEMDGKVFAYKDMEVGVNYPPFHPYCRTTVLSEIDDQDLSQLKRRSRDTDTGEIRTFPGDITYDKWYQQEKVKNPDIEFAKQVAKHRGADLAQYEKYLGVIGKKELGTISDFRETKYKKPEEYADLKTKYRELNDYYKTQESEIVITDTIKRVADKINAEAAGLEHRIKGRKSFLDKMARDAAGSNDPKAIKELLDGNHDILRYTYTGKPAELKRIFDDAVEELEARGYTLKSVKNTWQQGTAYKGVNCTFEAPDKKGEFGGHTKFELQFHTPESLEMKEKTHPDYKEMVNPETDPARRQELYEKMVELTDTLEFPANVDKIKMRR